MLVLNNGLDSYTRMRFETQTLVLFGRVDAWCCTAPTVYVGIATYGYAVLISEDVHKHHS